MASISETQQQAISDLEAGLDKLNPRNLKFASDLVRKGQKWSLSDKQMFFVKKFVAEVSGETPDSDSKPKAVPSSQPVAELVDKLDSLRPHLSSKSQDFAQSLIRQGRNKGWLSEKQMPFVHKMIAEAEESKAGRATRDAKYASDRAARAAARQAHLIATTPVGDDEAESGYEAVMELFDAAGSTLTRTKIHLITDSGKEVVVRSNRRKAESNSVLYVHHHGADNNRDAQFGHISKATASWNFTPATSEEVRAVMATFRDNPIQTVIDMGRKSGRCCFCSLPLTDERSTAHGYGKICAGHYGLAWSRATAKVIEGLIEAKVLEVIIMQDDKGNFAVKDRESGETIATFESREKANAFADQYCIVESV